MLRQIFGLANFVTDYAQSWFLYTAQSDRKLSCVCPAAKLLNLKAVRIHSFLTSLHHCTDCVVRDDETAFQMIIPSNRIVLVLPVAQCQSF